MSEKKRRVVIILGTLLVGGAERMVLELVKNIDRDRFCVDVVCYGIRHNTYLDDMIGKYCKLHYIGIKGRLTLRKFLFVLKYISNLAPDVIHAHLGGYYYAFPWAFLHLKAVVITVHSKPANTFSKKGRLMIKWLSKFTKFKLVAVSKENLLLVEQYFGFNNNQCVFINNGVNTDVEKDTHFQKFKFLNVARQDENKNQAMLIKAFGNIKKKYKNAELILVGDGPTNNFLRNLVSESGLDDCVRFTGIVEEPGVFYKEASVYVQSSHIEAMPMSILEAMAYGLPIISTRVGGIVDVVGENGILIEDGDAIGLQLAMEKLLNVDKMVLLKMGIISKKIVENYSSKAMAERYMDLYDELMNKTR